jgi:hypothetical protein
VKWEEWIGGAETSNEVVFERLDGSFGAVTAMNARGGQLEGNIRVIYNFVKDS